MQNAHGYEWCCRYPIWHIIIFEEEIQYQEHVRDVHNIPVEAQVEGVNRSSRQPRPEILECPFGDGFRPSKQGESNTILMSEALQLHIASHMEEIALLALRKLPNDVDDNTKDSNSDQPLEDHLSELPNVDFGPNFQESMARGLTDSEYPLGPLA